MSTEKLTKEQLKHAKKELICKFPKIEKLSVDPPLSGQNYGLFSFKMLPNPVGGIYGFIKFRGGFPTEDSYMKHAEYIIRAVDSKHKIWPYEHGRWMPITDNEEYAKETLSVSEQEEVKRIYNQKQTTEQQKAVQQVKEVEDRVKKLKEETMAKELDKGTLQYYAQQIMRKEHLESWLEDVRKKKRGFVKALNATAEQIKEIEEKHPEYLDQVENEMRKIKGEIGVDPDSHF